MLYGDFVDLGLSVKWYTSYDNSTYAERTYAWGTVYGEGYNYTWDSYKWGNKDKLTKYNNDDKLQELELEDDFFYDYLESGRIPSVEQWIELFQNCSVQSYIAQENSAQIIHYLKISSKTSVLTDTPKDSESKFFFIKDNPQSEGNSIILPSRTGFNTYENKLMSERFAYYWTRTVCKANKNCAYAIQFLNDNKYRIVAMPRCLGLFITGVKI